MYYKELDKLDSKFKPIVKDFEYNYWPIDNFENKLIIMTNKDAPKYKIELIDLNNPDSSWKTILPEVRHSFK